MKRLAGALGALLLAACAPSAGETVDTRDSIERLPTDTCTSVTSDAELEPGGAITGDPAAYAVKRGGCPRFVVDVAASNAGRLAIRFGSRRTSRACEAWLEHVRFYRLDQPETLADYSIAASPATCAFERPRLVAQIPTGGARYRIAISAHVDGTPLPISVSVEAR